MAAVRVLWQPFFLAYFARYRFRCNNFNGLVFYTPAKCGVHNLANTFERLLVLRLH